MKTILLAFSVAALGWPAPGQVPQITIQPRAATVSAGDAGWVALRVLSPEPLNVQWRRDGVNLADSGSQGTVYKYSPAVATNAGVMVWQWDVGRTFITPAPDTTGDYDAVVSNDYGSVTSAVARVTVQYVAPRILYEPYDAKVAVGLSVNLSCTAAYYWATFQWFKDQQPIAGATNSLLEIAAAQFRDAGGYQMVASNPAGSATSRVAQVTVAPLILGGPYRTSALTGNRVTLPLYPLSTAPVFYQWYFNAQPLAAPSRSILVFPAVDPANAGDYFAVASNRYGMVTSAVATLTVSNQAPADYAVAIQVGWYSTASARVNVGEQVKLLAVVSGGPPPRLRWRVDGTELPGETNAFIFFPAVPTVAAGQYTFVASNGYGAVTSAPARLDVVAQAPYIELAPMSAEQVAGSVVVLRSVATYGPESTLQWRHEGVDLPGQTNRLMVLPSATIEDAGSYEIVARNSLGEARALSELSIRPATGLDRWQWRLPQAQGSRLYSVAWGNGRYVAVGKAGNIITSTDGLHWTSALVEIDGDLTQVAFGNGVFVAVGSSYSPVMVYTNLVYSYPTWDGPVVITSADGLNWSVAPQPAELVFTSLTYGNGLFVACDSANSGGKTFVYTSVDGQRWTPRVFQGARANFVGRAGGAFMALAGGDVYYSTDALQWSSTPQAFYYGYVNTLGYGQGRYLVSGYGFVYVSEDGLTWRDYPLAGDYLKAIAAGPNRFVGATSKLGTLLVSEDGAAWREVDTRTSQELEDVIYANGAFMAVGEAGTIVTSADGVSWTACPVANGIDYYGLTSAGGLAVAAGDSGAVLTSNNGQTWTARPTPTTRNLHAVHYANGLFVAGGRKGALLTSPNAVTWTARASGLTNYIERIHWADGRWVAVADYGGITTSTDGLNWSPTNTGYPFTDHEGIAYGKGIWVAAGGYFANGGLGPAHATFYTSPDGLQWTPRPDTAGTRLRDVTYGEGRFLAVGNDGLMFLSTNGITWQSAYAYSPLGSENYRRAFCTQGRYIVIGNNGIMLSSATPHDPLSWVRHRSRSSQNLHDICALADGTLVALGNNGMVLQSGGTRPSFTAVRLVAGALAVDIDPQLAEGRLTLEATSDFTSWRALATGLGRQAQISVNDKPAEFYRLTIPKDQ